MRDNVERGHPIPPKLRIPRLLPIIHSNHIGSTLALMFCFVLTMSIIRFGTKQHLQTMNLRCCTFCKNECNTSPQTRL